MIVLDIINDSDIPLIRLLLQLCCIISAVIQEWSRVCICANVTEVPTFKHLNRSAYITQVLPVVLSIISVTMSSTVNPAPGMLFPSPFRPFVFKGVPHLDPGDGSMHYL